MEQEEEEVHLSTNSTSPSSLQMMVLLPPPPSCCGEQYGLDLIAGLFLWLSGTALLGTMSTLYLVALSFPVRPLYSPFTQDI